MLKALIATGLAAGLAAPAMAQPAGAPAAAPMQAGGWGAGGWQSGDVPVPSDMAAPADMPPPADMPRPVGPRPGAGAPPPGAMGAAPGYTSRWHGDYRRAERGGRLGGPWLDPRYTVQDWRGWGLAPPAPGMRWVRYYDDAVLVDGGGAVVDTRYGIDWDGPRPDRRQWRPGGGYPMGPANVAGTTSYRSGPNTVVTVQTVPTPVPAVYGGYPGYGYGGGTTVIATPGTITTTTTTSYERVSGWAPSHRRPVHRRCACRR